MLIKLNENRVVHRDSIADIWISDDRLYATVTLKIQEAWPNRGPREIDLVGADAVRLAEWLDSNAVPTLRHYPPRRRP